MIRRALKPLATGFLILILIVTEAGAAGGRRRAPAMCAWGKLARKPEKKEARQPPAERARPAEKPKPPGPRRVEAPPQPPAPVASAPRREFPVKLALTAGAGGLITLTASHFIGLLFSPEALAGALSSEEEDKLSRLRAEGHVRVPNLYEATRLADYLGIEQSADFRALPEDQRKELLQAIFDEVLKMPWKMRATLALHKHKIALVLGSVAAHPKVKDLKTPPHGRAPEHGWETVTGVTLGDLVIITADRLHDPNAKTRNLVLHEAAHSYDYRAELDTRPIAHVFGHHHGALSGSQAFREVFDHTNWGLRYYQDHPDEAFAESVARYYDSPASRAELKRDWPLAHEFVRRHFEEPDFPRR